MGDGGPPAQGRSTGEEPGSAGGGRFTRRYEDVRRDEFLDGPPPRSLADFIPDFGEEETRAVSGTEAVKCPFCDGFEGDEAAVTYHIDQEHLS